MIRKMKKQFGLWIDSQIWKVYRDLCRSEKLRPSEPIREFLGLVLRSGSPLAVVNMMQGMMKERSKSFEAYARVLLNWYKNGKMWIHVTDESEAPVEPMLVHALKDVVNPQLRKDIQETLMIRPRKQPDSIEEKKKPTETLVDEPKQVTISERIDNIKKQVEGRNIGPEQEREMLKKIHQIREKLKSNEKGRTKKR